MVLVSYASVPLYNLFCRTTGYGGTTQEAVSTPDKIYDREIRVTFTASTDEKLPWEFEPVQNNVTVRVGEVGLAHYRAKNLDNENITGMAVYNVTPEKAGIYFQKVHCFCFDQQTLTAGQEMPMPVTFFIDPEIMNDASMNDVEEINLNYIFYAQ
ncbi:MAG: cytochrome c oxidase assembly protein subunit 11 [Alphaproteobacteria bacterium]|jgi:cytochrome c oxidase assembly protein subunit 11